MSERTVLLLRHGETASHSENRYTGRTDLPLNATGLAQAAALARWAATAPIAAIWSSPLQRALTTAQTIAASAEVRVHVDPRFAELDFGNGEGLTADEMSVRFPAARAAFEVDPVRSPLPGGEDPRRAIARASAALEEALAASAEAPMDQWIVVVCHSTVLRLLVMHLIGEDPAAYRTRFPEVAPGRGIVILTDGVSASLLADHPELVAGSERGGGEHAG